jgi:hypothetical protein
MNHLYRQKWYGTIAVYLFAITSALIAYGYIFPSENNLVEVPSILSLLNPKIYQNDFYVQEQLQLGPRYYYQYLIFYTSKLGLSLPLTYFLYYAVSFASFITGLFAITRRFTKSTLAAGVLSFLSLAAVNGTIGSVDLFRTEPIPAIFAMGLTIWGLYFSFCKQWKLGYLFFGLACLLQFLVGALPGIMIAPLVIWDATNQKKLWPAILPFLILGLLASLVYVPMTIGNRLDTPALSDTEFIYLYGYIRHPHHIIPSSWSVNIWRNFILFMLAGILLIQSSRLLNRENKVTLMVLIGTSLTALFIGYLFVEVYPVAFVAKLQLARTTPFAQLAVLIALSTLIYEQYKKGNLILSLLLLVVPTFKDSALMLFILAVLCSTHRFRSIATIKLITWIFLASALILIELPLLPLAPALQNGILISEIRKEFWKLVLLFSLMSPFIWEQLPTSWLKKAVIPYLFALVSSLFLLLGIIGFLPQKLLNSFQGNIKLLTTRNGDLEQLALRFRQLSHEEALVLVPPSNYSFRFYSQRSVVFDFKSFPFSDRGIEEWKTRMNVVLGSNVTSANVANVDSWYRDRSASDLENVARQFHASYILTNTDWHSTMNGHVVDQEGKWIIYQLKPMPMSLSGH